MFGYKYSFLTVFALFSLVAHAKSWPYLRKGQILSQQEWELVYSEDFRMGKTIDLNWISNNSSPEHILSSRWRENLRVRGGKLVLSNKKENRGGKEWTTANLISKRRFKYGYFECRMKISGASGLNNAFWLNCEQPSKEMPAFEIDIVEGHYPNSIHYAIHNWGTATNRKHSSKGDKIESDDDLTKKYHIYGLFWDESIIQFYFDGKLIWEQSNEFCYSDVDIRLSTAVITWAGPVTDAIDGTDMRVDYVRVWQAKNH